MKHEFCLTSKLLGRVLFLSRQRRRISALKALIKMNILRNQIVALIFCFAVFSVGSVYANSLFKGGDVIWNAGNNVFFKYANQDKTIFGKNDHPVEVTAQDISTVLGSLKIRNKELPVAEEKLQPVFSAKQTKLLGDYLAIGLKNAKPDQDVIFAMEKSKRRLLGLQSDRLFVAGRAFYKDDKLNVIVGDYDRPRDEGYEAAYDPTNVGIVRYHFDYGSREKISSNFSKTIVKVDGVKHKKVDNTQRDNWLVIDVQAAFAANARNAKNRQQEATARKREEIREILDSEAAPSVKRSTPSLEDRFTTLQQLKDKGLITDEEYAEKRKQLLIEL